MRLLMSKMRGAMQKYGMIKDGDKIAVGVSGGKDSVALLCALAELRRFYPASYSLYAFTLDPRFFGKPADYSPIKELCQRLRVPYHVECTDLWEIVFEIRKEKNPCSLCAKMRRGILHGLAKNAGCNKIALGHHLDDAAETFYMNLLNGGKIGCFSPVSYLSRRDLTMIRPMIFAREREIVNAVSRLGLPVVKSACPVDGETERRRVSELLSRLETDYDDLRAKTVGALQRSGIDGW
ncbi:MAG TPA: tRNA 2-thiocytidine(32) synthetase TtcA [Ruminococcaceae bacterium]|nr:tRNA 2-thiocytidine(32) synthetase TtcA [Oscillospiraceae bacterium]